MSRRSDSSRPASGPDRGGTKHRRGVTRAGNRRPGSSGTDPDAVDDTAAGRRLSFRSAVILGALVIVAAGLVKPIGTGLAQMQQIAALEADIESTRGEVEQLQDERERLNDPEHVERLARERMGYVREGESAYIVVGDEDDDARLTAQAGASKAVRARPWYAELADSLRQVGYAYEDEEDR